MPSDYSNGSATRKHPAGRPYYPRTYKDLTVKVEGPTNIPVVAHDLEEATAWAGHLNRAYQLGWDAREKLKGGV